MGYTHYWYRERELDAEIFKLWSDDVRKLIAESPVGISGGLGEGQPETTNVRVWFNGTEPTDHETFVIEQSFVKEYDAQEPDGDGRFFAFCKTARKPYDLIVTAALVAFKFRFGDDVEVRSDGDVEDWDAGVALCNEVLGYGECPIMQDA